jgi:hypothetical protein
MDFTNVSDSPPHPEDLGRHYGFRHNPYDPSPLGIDQDDSSLFVGRDQEGREFRTFLASFDRGAVFIEGGTGVGKTSFVNVQEYRIEREESKPRLLPTLQAIQLASTLSPTEFLLSVLSNVLNSLGRSIPRAVRATEFKDLSRAVTQSLVRTRGWQIDVAGFGAGRSTDSTATSPLFVLLPAVSELLDRAALLAQDAGIPKIVVNVNNLDLIDSKTLVSFLEVTRDLTLTRAPFLWVFIGPIGSRAGVAQRSRRVSELIRSDPIWLPPLTSKEVHNAIEARVHRFRNTSSVTPPISQDVLDLLYVASSGELRYILNRCTDLLIRTMIEFPTSRELSLDLARPLLRRMTMSAIDRCNLTTKQKSLLGRLVADGPCQPKEFRKYGLQSVPAFLRYLLRFYELGLVDRRRSGSEVVYTPRGDAILALGSQRS